MCYKQKCKVVSLNLAHPAYHTCHCNRCGGLFQAAYTLATKSTSTGSEIGDITFFSGWRSSTVLDFKFRNSSHSTVVTLRSCTSLQKFTKIGQSVAELLPKPFFFHYGVRPPSLIYKYEFQSNHYYQSHCTKYSVPNFIVIGPFLSEVIIMC